MNKVKVIAVCNLSTSAFKTTINLDFLATVLIRLININRIGLIKIPPLLHSKGIGFKYMCKI